MRKHNVLQTYQYTKSTNQNPKSLRKWTTQIVHSKMSVIDLSGIKYSGIPDDEWVNLDITDAVGHAREHSTEYRVVSLKVIRGPTLAIYQQLGTCLAGCSLAPAEPHQCSWLMLSSACFQESLFAGTHQSKASS